MRLSPVLLYWVNLYHYCQQKKQKSYLNLGHSTLYPSSSLIHTYLTSPTLRCSERTTLCIGLPQELVSPSFNSTTP